MIITEYFTCAPDHNLGMSLAHFYILLMCTRKSSEKDSKVHPTCEESESKRQREKSKRGRGVCVGVDGGRERF